MNEVVRISYTQPLVMFSILIAFLGASIALTATSRLQDSPASTRPYYLLIAGAALGGLGTWSMHFVGMLAMRMPLGLSYSLAETVVSLLVAVVCATAALNIVSHHRGSMRHLLAAGLLMGTGIAAMHYMGMYSMRFEGFFQWNLPLLALSLVIAVLASTLALWLAFHSPSPSRRMLAASVMAIAICSMHYTGMFAADVVCTTSNPLAIPTGTGLLSVMELPMMVITFVVGITLAIGACLMALPALSKRHAQRPPGAVGSAPGHPVP